MKKQTQVRVRVLTSIAPQVAEIMVSRLGLPAIVKAYKSDKYQGVYVLIRPELPCAITDSEVRNIANALIEQAKEAVAPLPIASRPYNIYLPED